MFIAVLVSGGVDSSVALARLKEQGYNVTAFYLKIWLEDELSYLGSCPWEEDLAYATQACERLGVPLQVISMQKPYWDRVVAYTIAEVKAGRTPNPDVLCNQQVKFGAFYDVIGDEYDFVATGHYAQVEHQPEVSLLKKAVDPVKDQTYFLSYLSQSQLKKVLFPIGDLPKSRVRELAEAYGFDTSQRKDSQGICFLGKFKFSDFLRAHLGEQNGDLIEFETGEKIGEHPGFWFYTVGQRQGIGLSGGPWYVVAKDAVKNQVIISRNYEQVEEAKAGMRVKKMNWLSSEVREHDNLEVINIANVTRFKGIEMKNGALEITLKEKSSQGIAVGQFAVLYDGEVCLGGGIIDEVF